MRALMMAGGGIKVGFQAGVLQVWLDEAGLEFDVVDGASGGCLNLAMYCEGRTGRQIADAWRDSEPLAGIGLDLGDLLHARALISLDRYRENVLRGDWALDWDAIRSSDRLGLFNLCNFTEQRLEVVENRDMDEDRLISAISLPMWFPPVEIDGSEYIDAVYITDGNLEEVVRRGADEIWAIWTVSRAGEWSDGFVNQYFQIIEITANGRFFDTWHRIEASNAEIAAGREGEFGRHIELHLLEAEVAVHYLLNFSADRMTESVNAGVLAAREWCREHGIALSDGGPVAPPTPPSERSGLYFSEVMRGHATAGVTDPSEGDRADGRVPFTYEVSVVIEDIDVFVEDPRHETALTGWIDSPILGGRRQIEEGTFNLFVAEADPTDRRMIYRATLRDAQGQPRTVVGKKVVHDDPGLDLWADITTLYVRVLDGQVPEADEDRATVLAAGVVRIHTLDLARQLASVRTHGPDLASRARAVARFGRLFMGKLWDTHGHRIVPFGPV